MYNIALEVKIYAYRAHGKSLSEYDLTKQLTDAKKEHTWLKDFSAQTLELEIHNLDKAYKDFLVCKLFINDISSAKECAVLLFYFFTIKAAFADNHLKITKISCGQFLKSFLKSVIVAIFAPTLTI